MAKELPYRPGAGVMLLNQAGLVWAGMRRDTAGAWQMPQGGLDEGEDPRAAALRELEEETGISPDLVDIIAETGWVSYDLPPELLGKVWKGRYRGQRQKWYLMRFHGDDSAVDIAQDHPEFSQWRWMRADDLLTHIVPFKRTLYVDVIDSFRTYLT